MDFDGIGGEYDPFLERESRAEEGGEIHYQ